MKRFLALSLSAIVLVELLSSSAYASVDVSLNIVYNDPAHPNFGGSWTLVAKTDTPGSQGIEGLVTRFLNMPPAGTVNPNIGHDIFGGALLIGSFDHDNDANTPPQTEFVYGQDPSVGSPLIVGLVGLPGGPSNLVNDPLGDNANWANSSVIATGTIPNLTTMPSFVSAAANERIFGTLVAAQMDLKVVRTLEVPEPAAGLLEIVGACLAFCRRRRI